MDVLSEVLKAVRLDGALFYNGEFSAPWCFRSPASRAVAPYFSPDSGHVIIFHLLTEGRGYAHIEGEERPVPLNAGDVIIFPHGDPHFMGNGSAVKAVDMAKELERISSQGLKISRMGGGGEITKFICGYMACEPQLSRVFLGGLPPVLKINIRNDASGQWLEDSIRYSVGNADASRPGGEAVIAKLSEVLFVEPCDVISRCFRPNKPGGWRVSVIRKLGKPWRCCIASQRILGRFRRSLTMWGFPAPYWPSASGVICQRRPLPT
jgi:hypothetical protein